MNTQVKAAQETFKNGRIMQGKANGQQSKKWKRATITLKRAQSRQPMNGAGAENSEESGNVFESDVACEPAKKNAWSRDWFVQNENWQGS